METVEKSNFNYAKWLMIGFLSTSKIAFIIMMTLTPKLKGDDLIFSVLIGYSVIGFIIGMFFFVAYLVNWISAAGFGIFILLMVFGIYLFNDYMSGKDSLIYSSMGDTQFSSMNYSIDTVSKQVNP